MEGLTRFQLIAVFRSNHERHLSMKEIRLAKAVAKTHGNDGQFISDDGETYGVSVSKLLDPTAEKAMAFYKTVCPGGEIVSCEPITE